MMLVAIREPMATRPCAFCLVLQGGSVFADFDTDEDGRVYAVRVSYDMFGCCHAPATIGRMNREDSRALLEMVARGRIDAADADAILRRYFSTNMTVLWPAALQRHALV